MTASRRWQDYATMIIGVLLFVSPFVFGETSHQAAAYSAYILGVLLFLSGVLATFTRAANATEAVPAILGVITFVSPWIFGFSAVTSIAWTSWVLGIVALVNAGSLLLAGRGQRMSTV
jgi:uncharacterized membrane protein HdeD (DUF308 family)